MIAALKLPEDFDRMDADYEKFRAYLIGTSRGRLIVRHISGILLPDSCAALAKLHGIDCSKIWRHFGGQPRPHQECRGARGGISRAGRPDRRRRFRDERGDGQFDQAGQGNHAAAERTRDGHAPGHGRTADHRAHGHRAARARHSGRFADRRAGGHRHRWRSYEGENPQHHAEESP